MAEALIINKDEILKANDLDLKASMEKGTSKAMLDRLALSEERIEGMADGLRQIVCTSRSSWRSYINVEKT